MMRAGNGSSAHDPQGGDMILRAGCHKMAIFCFAAALAVIFLPAMGRAQKAPAANYDESKVGKYTLPDPLVFANGRPVTNAQDWAWRRVEILRLFASDVYGHSPRPPAHTLYTVFDTDPHALGGTAIRKEVSIYFSSQKKGLHEDLLLYIPAGAKGPVPVILSLNFRGNQAVTSDPGVKLAMLWDSKTHQRVRATDASRGSDHEFDVPKVLARGYGFATIYYQDIEPDFAGGWKYGIQPLFFKPGQTAPEPDDWGAIGAWAYGLSRAMDFLQNDKDVDSHRVAIMGHSRLGKTVLWAGAEDTRFAMVLSNCSGEGGAALMRRNYGETIPSMMIHFPFWFCGNLKKYADHINDLPVDSHELIALVAPRPVYITSAEKDQWADPRGMFLACVAAGKVYRLLGAEGLDTEKFPAVNHPIQHTIAFHMRDGVHTVTAFDWEQFLKFADQHLRAN
jgi:(4-O-methyl)-D-glucuronate---lignin esterase